MHFLRFRTRGPRLPVRAFTARSGRHRTIGDLPDRGHLLPRVTLRLRVCRRWQRYRFLRNCSRRARDVSSIIVIAQRGTMYRESARSATTSMLSCFRDFLAASGDLGLLAQSIRNDEEHHRPGPVSEPPDTGSTGRPPPAGLRFRNRRPFHQKPWTPTAAPGRSRARPAAQKAGRRAGFVNEYCAGRSDQARVVHRRRAAPCPLPRSRCGEPHPPGRVSVPEGRPPQRRAFGSNALHPEIYIGASPPCVHPRLGGRQ